MSSTAQEVRYISNRWWATAAYFVVISAIVVIVATSQTGWTVAATIALGVAACAAVMVRERYPYALVVVAWVTTLSSTQMLLVPALFSLGVRRRNVVSVGALAVSLAALAAVFPRGEQLVSIDGVDLNVAGQVVAWLLNAVAVIAVPYALGVALNVRRELIASYEQRALAAEQQREARDREAVLLERQRIAGETHDVLGHKLALISMQAGALEMNAKAGADEVERQAARIGQTARDGMFDLRSIVGALDGHGAQTLTAPSLRSLDALVEDSIASGAEVSIDTSALVMVEQVPEDLSRAGHRIVQEALTNAHRHSPGTPVRVVVSGAVGRGIDIEVRNRMSTNDMMTEDGRYGRGLPGLRERARSVGGTCTAGVEGRDFVLRARLPWPALDERRWDGRRSHR